MARLLGRSGGASLLLSATRRLSSPFVTVITYHRVVESLGMSEYDEGVCGVTGKTFDLHCAELKRSCNVISLSTLRHFAQGGSLPPNPVLITFDDGYRDNHDAALPILQKHGLTAVFFIATSYITKRRLFWWDAISHLVKRTKRASIELEYPRGVHVPLASSAERAAATALLLRIVKDTYSLDLDRYLDHLAERLDVRLSPEEYRRRADELLLTWDQVRAMRRAGMDMQSHTQTHRVVQTLDAERLKEELTGSRRVLEEVLDEPTWAISYPVGRPIRDLPAIRDAVRDAGYELGFSNRTGVNLRWDFDPLDVRRMSMDGVDSANHLRGVMAVPYLSY